MAHILLVLAVKVFEENCCYDFFQIVLTDTDGITRVTRSIPPPRLSYQCHNLDSPPKFNHLFTGPLLAFPENFMQIRLDIFVQSC